MWYNQRAKCHSFNIVTSCCSFISFCCGRLLLLLIILTMAVFGDRDSYARFVVLMCRRHRHILFPHCHFTLVSFTKPIRDTKWKSTVLQTINCLRPTHEKKIHKTIYPPAFSMTNRIAIYNFFHFATYIFVFCKTVLFWILFTWCFIFFGLRFEMNFHTLSMSQLHSLL